MREVWFWHRIISPHAAPLARALAHLGCKVTYVAAHDLSDHRRELGWRIPSLEGVELQYASQSRDVAALVATAGPESVHLCEGLRETSPPHPAASLAARGLRRWVVMETIDERGWRGRLKAPVYSAAFRWQRARLEGVLAIGQRTPDWVIARGVPREGVFPFAYFLEDQPLPPDDWRRPDGPFRFAFVGQFIERKRLPVLLDALAVHRNRSAELVVLGSGPLGDVLKAEAMGRLPGRVHWLGRRLSSEVLQVLDDVDCLVLPSQHDGWGAVVSEALMRGTPAICSDSCGAAEVVSASGVGGVFGRDDEAGLADLISATIAAGRPSPSERLRLARWATSLGADAGARYLLAILSHVEGRGARPQVPWIREAPPCAV
jgi:glycosyltransferase involved in cell wall biosynthesis